MVLAAGGGTRFAAGRPGDPDRQKLLVEVRGRPMVSWAMQAALDSGLPDVLLVTGGAELPVMPGVTVVRNERWAEGQATSLAAGIAAAQARGHDRVVVGLGDQPGVTASAWRTVASAPSDKPIVVATYNGRRGNPVRLAAAVWPLLPTEGDEGARVLMRMRPDLVAEVACEGDPTDVDTVEDLEAWS